ncbi:hypothetical protein V6N12_039612 [Hibiscus sabdariffa]|uniref:CASP-like protein n=1 Tax=Hibiscus sabdariffa TaxID=183260 RepID=A0ABR2E1A8_9ROSI
MATSPWNSFKRQCYVTVIHHFLFSCSCLVLNRVPRKWLVTGDIDGVRLIDNAFVLVAAVATAFADSTAPTQLLMSQALQ